MAMKTTTTLAIAALSLLPLAGVAQAEPAHISNAEMAAACAVPANRDINVTRTVYVGVRRGVSAKVMLAGFEAGWVESHMNNLNCGDRDSLGVFQQRPSQGWGTPEQILNVDYAANAFFAEAQRVEPKYPNLSAGLLADKVQRSCCPARYDQAEAKARQMLDEVSGFVVYGDIGTKWRAMGAENSVVGRPTNNESAGAYNGRWQRFERGHIYWTAATNAHPVYGEILTKFMNSGDEHRWGYPVNDESPGASGGRWQKFQNANFYWISSTSAFPVFGEILINFMNNGDEHRWGYPLNEESVGANGGRWQKFQNGIWYWSARTSAYPVYGDILKKFGTTGDEHTHGYPVEAEKEWAGEAGGRTQKFENSTFYWTPAKGAWSVNN